MAFYIPVEKKLAQRTLEKLKGEGKIDSAHHVMEREGRIWIPVNEKMKGAVELEGEERRRSAHSLGEALSGILSKDEMNEVVGSFDLIGDIAIIEVPESLAEKEKEIAKAIMDVHKNVKVVVKKEGPMEGPYRTRRLSHVLGENRTETMHKENGVRMLLDVATVYFSPRLSYERKRIAGLVKDGERILALFAGVGPFPLVIAKSRKCEIVAIELNPAAVEYMRRNVELNKARTITALEGDVGKIVPEKYADFADRVLMPLPKDAEEFLKAAYIGAKDGGVVHFYCFAGMADPFGDARKKIFSHLAKDSVEIMGERIVRPFSPSSVQVAVDFKVKKPARA